MIAAVRVELRAFWGQLWVRLLLPLAALFPLVAQGLHLLANNLSGSTGSIGMSYPDTMSSTLTFTGIAVLLSAATIAHTPHRHNVFQSYVVTGFPRDLMLLARLAAAGLVTLALGAVSLMTALILHVAEYQQHGLPFVQTPDAISNLSATAVAGDVLAFFVMLLLASTFVVGLVSFTRNMVGAIACIGIYLLFENIVIGALQNSWASDARLVPLRRIGHVPVGFPDPFWSVQHAIPQLTHGVLHQPWLAAATLLFAWCLVACTAAAIRLVRGDA